jgi:hypothetical protein
MSKLFCWSYQEAADGSAYVSSMTVNTVWPIRNYHPQGDLGTPNVPQFIAHHPTPTATFPQPSRARSSAVESETHLHLNKGSTLFSYSVRRSSFISL